MEDVFNAMADICRPRTRDEKINYYCALFEKVYGEQPAADLSTCTDEEIDQAINELNQLL